MINNNDERKNICTTLNKELYSNLKILALQLSLKEDKKINANDLIEEGMIYILNKYGYKE